MYMKKRKIKQFIKLNPFLFFMITVLCMSVGTLAYIGYNNLEDFYKEFGIEQTKQKWSLVLFGYKFLITSILAVVAGLKIAEWLKGYDLKVKKIVKLSWWWIGILVVSPIYLLAEMAYQMKYSMVLNNVVLSCGITMMIVFIFSLKNVAKNLKRIKE